MEGQEESEGQKERRCDKSVGPQRRGGGLISTAVLCCVLQAPQVNGEGVGGLKNFKTLHLHELDRPLENTRATFEKATLYKVKRERSGEVHAQAHTPTQLRIHTYSDAHTHTHTLAKLSVLKYCHDTLQYPDGSE